MKRWAAILVVAAQAASIGWAAVSEAAFVKVIGVNTGETNVTGTNLSGTNSPAATIGAKGFLLAIDFNDGLGNVFTAVQDFIISGPIVQWQAPNAFNEGAVDDINVQTRSEGTAVQSYSTVENPPGDMPPGATNFLREDSAWWNSPQTIGGQTRSWTPVATGIELGLPGDNVMQITATLGSVGQTVPSGTAKLVYVVATGDFAITGTIVRTASQANATGVLGGPIDEVAYIDFDSFTVEEDAPDGDRLWLDSAGGSFDDSSNWWPWEVPGPFDRVVLDTDAEYSIDFAGTETVDQVRVRSGSVVLELNGFSLDVVSASGPGVVVGEDLGDEAALTIVDGTVTSVSTKLGAVSGSSGTLSVAQGATHDAAAVEIGVGGTGSLEITGGGSVVSGEAVVAKSAGSSGNVLMTGSTSVWSADSLYVGGSAVANGGEGFVALQGGTLDVAGTLKLWNDAVLTKSASAVLHAGATEIAGGTLVATSGVNLADLGGISGYGTLNGRVSGSSTITANGGALTLGSAGSIAGYNATGSLDVAADAQAILLDADSAQLGATTTLAAGARLSTLNGAELGMGETLTATGSAEIDGSFTNQGVVNGPSEIGQLLTFTDDVDGAGSYTGNVLFSDGFSPGNSPAAVSLENVTFDGSTTLTIELGGLVAGSQFDQLNVSGNATLAGTLIVELIDNFSPALGDQFAVLEFASRSGTFASYLNTELDGFLELRPYLLTDRIELRARPQLDGDINLDGTVDIFDVGEVSDYWETTGPLGDVNGSGMVDIFDVGVISDHWLATIGSGEMSQSVPEPSALLLLVLGALVAGASRAGKAWLGPQRRT